MFLLLVFSKTRDNKGSPKVCHSNSCFTGFCAAHCMYGPQTLHRSSNVSFKELEKKKQEEVEGLFWQGQREIKPVPGPYSITNQNKR